MNKITIFDTSICSENLGDLIIMDSVRDILFKIFQNYQFFSTLTHDKINKPSYNIIKQSKFSFIGGTNLLSSNMNRYNQWKVNLLDGIYINNAILMGVGWWQYQPKINLYTRLLLKLLLQKDYIHSVRDEYSFLKLKAAGFSNVINTACPTMWSLNEKHCSKIPKEKADCVITTLTDYNQNPKKDFEILNLLINSYKKVFFWPQGSGDYQYVNKMNLNKIQFISPNLFSYNKFLKDEGSVDYIGTRLHAGIRALQMGKRTIIIGIDNRAIEKSKDFGLNVCPRDDLEKLKSILNKKIITNINLPLNNINFWKSQFN